MKILSARLETSAPDASGFPKDGLPQIALAGRSNAGKSSLINALCNSKSLARSSQQPGKTRLINFYRINDAFYLVDLPGFGYAKVGHEGKELMEIVLRAFFDASMSLRGVLYLVDPRVPDSPVDHAALEWILDQEIPLQVLARVVVILNIKQSCLLEEKSSILKRMIMQNLCKMKKSQQSFLL